MNAKAKPAVCTLGELRAAVRWMNADFDGDIDLIHTQNGDHYWNASRNTWGFRPDGTVARDVAAVVHMNRPGFATRTAGKFVTLESGPVDQVPLAILGERCPAFRWVILYRLFLCSVSNEVVEP